MNSLSRGLYIGCLLITFNLSAEEQKAVAKQENRISTQLPNGENVLSWSWDDTDQDKMIIKTGTSVISGRPDSWWRNVGQSFPWQITQKHVVEALNEFYRLQKEDSGQKDLTSAMLVVEDTLKTLID